MNEARRKTTMRRLSCAVLFVLLVPLASAADVTGKWSGSLEGKDPDGETVTVPAHADLKQQGDSITGKVWKEIEHQFSIEKGKIEGNRIAFEFKAPEGSEDAEPLVHSVRLTVVGEDQLQGELEVAMEGGKMTGKLTFAREK
jgi:hypothetical protein